MIYGWIYKLFCLDTGKFYIGSTQNLRTRINKHKSKNQDTTSRIIIDKNNYIFLILQEGFYVNKDHLEIIETTYIEKLDCVNKNRSISTREEESKRYREKNKEIVLEKTKEWRKNNQEKVKELHRNYCENNKEKLKEYYKNYDAKRNSIKINCEFCKKEMIKRGMKRHLENCKSKPKTS